jgi:hypothetical protein
VRRTWAKSVLPRSRDLGTRQKKEKPVDAWTEKEKEKRKRKRKALQRRSDFHG